MYACNAVATVETMHFASIVLLALLFCMRMMGRHLCIQGLPLTMPHGMVESPYGIDFLCNLHTLTKFHAVAQAAESM